MLTSLALSSMLAAAPVTTALPPKLPPAPECRKANGQQACGFNCLTYVKGVRCSSTPEGLCELVDGEPVCWDPPLEVRLHPTPRVATCHSKFGTRVCGYDCATTETRIACAQTPWGRCTAKFNRPVCWDPAPELIHQQPKELATAKCLATDDETACGWACRSSYQSVRCAQTPTGVCTAQDGKVMCFDPQLPPIAHAVASPSRDVASER